MENITTEFEDIEVIKAEEEEEMISTLENIRAEKEKRLLQEFLVAYQNLVREYGYQIVGVPVFVPSRSSFEIMVDLIIEKVK